MEWEQKTNWYMQSDQGYRISKATSKCPGQYTAWAPGSKDSTPAIGHVDTPNKAMQLCEEHLNNQRSKP